MASATKPTPRPQPLYLIRFSQTHLSFRLAELVALERLFNDSFSCSPPRCSKELAALLQRRQAKCVHAYLHGRNAPSSQPSHVARQACDDGSGGGGAAAEGKGVDEANVRDEVDGPPPKPKCKLILKVEAVRYTDASPFCLVRFRLRVRLRVPSRWRRRRLSGTGTSRDEDNTTTNTTTMTPTTTKETTETGQKAFLAAQQLGRQDLEWEWEEVEIDAFDDNDDDDNGNGYDEEEILTQVAREFIKRSVQARGIYEVWGVADVDDHVCGNSAGQNGGRNAEGDKRSPLPHLSAEKKKVEENGTATTGGLQDGDSDADAGAKGSVSISSASSPTTAAQRSRTTDALSSAHLLPPDPITTTTTATTSSSNSPSIIPSSTPPNPLPTLPSITNINPMYTTLHASAHRLSSHRWSRYQGDNARALKFKFGVDTFNHSRTPTEQRDIINSFAYLDFGGVVRMKGANEEWVVFEEWVGPCSLPVAVAVAGSTRTTQEHVAVEERRGGEGAATATAAAATTTGEDKEGEVPLFDNTHRELRRLYFGRVLETRTLRPVIEKHDLKKRPYISTTSMDAELALVTANLALAGPGKIFLDPFCGTGGFLVAAAELGAWVLGTDIDGRSFRGKSGKGVEGGVGRNVRKYALERGFGGCLTSDLVNTPLRIGRSGRWLDGIVCDPPYGVREGLKVLGTRSAPLVEGEKPRGPHLIDGVPAHTLPGYVAPKKPYSFERMLDDVLDFAARTLVDAGRLAFWMPSANENELGEEVETSIPQHPALELKHVCVQRFNRWSRRLLVYERRKGEIEDLLVDAVQAGVSTLDVGGGVSNRADDLNPFRKRYFQAFAVNGDSEVGG